MLLLEAPGSHPCKMGAQTVELTGSPTKTCVRWQSHHIAVHSAASSDQQHGGCLVGMYFSCSRPA